MEFDAKRTFSEAESALRKAAQDLKQEQEKAQQLHQPPTQKSLAEQAKAAQEEADRLYGTERDNYHCAFYLKTGSCRYGAGCGKYHPYPRISETVLFKNMYDGLGLTEVLDEDADDSLMYDEEEVKKHYGEFYNDVVPEFRKFGELVQFKTCRNYAQHLRGNVYVQYNTLEAALAAFNAFNGRYYAAKRLLPEFAPVTNWQQAVCGLFDKGRCPRGKACNFLHVFRNPNNEYPLYEDEKEEKRSDRYADRYRGERYRDEKQRSSRDRDDRRDRDRDRDDRRDRDRDDRRDKDDRRDRDRDDRKDRDKDERRDRDKDERRDRDDRDRRHSSSHKRHSRSPSPKDKESKKGKHDQPGNSTE